MRIQVKSTDETQEKTIHDTELNSQSTLTDTESKLSQKTTSKFESKTESTSEPKQESKAESKLESKVESNQESKQETKKESKAESIAPQPVVHSYVFICNTDSMCYHTHECQAAKKILPENRLEYTVNAYSEFEAMQYMVNQGYHLCGICAR